MRRSPQNSIGSYSDLYIIEAQDVLLRRDEILEAPLSVVEFRVLVQGFGLWVSVALNPKPSRV